jgi:hypothetical protein
MNQPAHKCDHCKKAFQHRKIDQRYCSNKCRQAAYRNRQQCQDAKKPRPAPAPLLVAICDHCGGSFWAKTRRSRFCSTSCRTMNHRHMKTALKDTLAALYSLPEGTAAELIEMQPVTRLKALLADAGLFYSAVQKAWISQPSP